jgi:phospholipid transport system transporter-binding protein
MIQRDGERVLLEGPVTFATAASVLEAAASETRAGARIVDFSAVTESDSAALALALELLRQAEAEKRAVTFANVPDALHKLAELYSVSEVVFAA